MEDKEAAEQRTSFEDEKAGKDEYREVVINGEIEVDSRDVLEFKRKEKRLVKKLDMFIAPVMFLLQLISYLDRGLVAIPFKRPGGLANIDKQHWVCGYSRND